MNYLGSKNILLVLAAAAIIGGAFIFSQYRNSSNSNGISVNENSVTPLLVATTTSTLEPVPYSGDWQKTLSTAAGSSSWATPKSASSASGADNTPLTRTDIFSRDLFARFVEAKKNGEDTSATATQLAIVGQVMKDGTILPSPKVYGKNNIRIGNDNSLVAIKKYGNTIATIFKTNIPGNQPNELIIVQNALDNNDPSILKKLTPIITSYQKTIEDLQGVVAPSGIADFHLGLVNAMSEITFSDQGMTKTFTDGITSLQGLGLYKQSINDLSNAFNSIARYFVTVNIVFGPAEPGALFNITSK